MAWNLNNYFADNIRPNIETFRNIIGSANQLFNITLPSL
jgi:hypothetical protein